MIPVILFFTTQVFNARMCSADLSGWQRLRANTKFFLNEFSCRLIYALFLKS